MMLDLVVFPCVTCNVRFSTLSHSPGRFYVLERQGGKSDILDLLSMQNLDLLRHCMSVRGSSFEHTLHLIRKLKSPIGYRPHLSVPTSASQTYFLVTLRYIGEFRARLSSTFTYGIGNPTSGKLCRPEPFGGRWESS